MSMEICRLILKEMVEFMDELSNQCIQMDRKIVCIFEFGLLSNLKFRLLPNHHFLIRFVKKQNFKLL